MITDPRETFDPTAYSNDELTPTEVAEYLERRARGYGGNFREMLCTAVVMVRRADTVVSDHPLGDKEI